MKLFHTLAVVLAATTFSFSAAIAGSGTFKVGSITVDAKVAEEYCPADVSHPFDKAWLDIQIKSNTNMNEVMGAFMLCDELAQFRRGTPINLSRWIILMSPTQGGNIAKPMPGISREQFIELMDAEIGKGIEIDIDALNKKTNNAASEVLDNPDLQPITISSDNTPTPLGTTDAGAFMGLTMRIAAEDTTLKVGAVVGMTMVKQYMVSINVYKLFDQPDTINQLLAEADTIIDDFVVRNGN